MVKANNPPETPGCLPGVKCLTQGTGNGANWLAVSVLLEAGQYPVMARAVKFNLAYWTGGRSSLLAAPLLSDIGKIIRLDMGISDLIAVLSTGPTILRLRVSSLC